MSLQDRYGRVGVVMGGEGAERQVSLDGGRDVAAALAAQGVDVRSLDGIPAVLAAIAGHEIDRVFNLLHGRMGEDGTLQGALECVGVPYTGSGVLGSALSLNKVATKRVWQACGLATADFRVVRDAAAAVEAASVLGYPLVVKPVSEGSSVGVSIVSGVEALPAALERAFGHEATVMLEAFVPGAEYTVGVIHGQALPVVRITPDREFYDYAAKYESDSTGYHCPSGLTAAAELALQDLAIAAFESVECKGWGRVDFIGSVDTGLQLLEVNTTPGMTSHSLVPKAAAAAGLSFEALCLRILDTSLKESSA